MAEHYIPEGHQTSPVGPCIPGTDIPMEPMSDVEKYLATIAGVDGIALSPPKTRVEAWLERILDNMVTPPVPPPPPPPVGSLVHFQQILDFDSAESLEFAGLFSTKDPQAHEFILDGSITSYYSYAYPFRASAQHFINGHTYLKICNLNSGLTFVNSSDVKVFTWDSTTDAKIFGVDNAVNFYGTVYAADRRNYNNVHMRMQIFDLTAMFADCPELEPITVEDFKAIFPEDYYPYTAQPYDVYIQAEPNRAREALTILLGQDPGEGDNLTALRTLLGG